MRRRLRRCPWAHHPAPILHVIPAIPTSTPRCFPRPETIPPISPSHHHSLHNHRRCPAPRLGLPPALVQLGVPRAVGVLVVLHLPALLPVPRRRGRPTLRTPRRTLASSRGAKGIEYVVCVCLCLCPSCVLSSHSRPPLHRLSLYAPWLLDRFIDHV